jgi:Integral membrane protein TerC family
MGTLAVPLWIWAVTIGALVLALGIELAVGIRRGAHEVGMREATLWTAAVVGLAVAFGLSVRWLGHPAASSQFFAGWPYLIFTANMFALLGLRQLYFLIGGLLSRLVYLSAGLAVILGFIGVKLITEALAESGVHAVGPVPVPDISTGLSLAIIGGVLAVVTVTSLLAGRRQPQPPRKLSGRPEAPAEGR